MDAIDLGAVEARKEEQQEREAERDEFGFLLEDYGDLGGKKEDLVAAVTALIEKQRRGGENSDLK